MYKDNNIKEVYVSYHLIKPVSKQTLVCEDALDLKYKVYSIKVCSLCVSLVLFIQQTFRNTEYYLGSTFIQP